MGDNVSCLRSSSQEDAFLQNEMRIYRWRADPRANAYLPQVSFSSTSQTSRNRFARFLEQSNKNYLRIQEFKKQTDIISGDMLVFERFSCTLEQVQGVFNVAEAAYALTAISAAFSGLLMELQEVVVSRNCWFATKNGHVRVWINHDPRCNFIDPSSSEQIFGENNSKGIAFKMLSELLKCCQQSGEILAIFTFIREEIEKKNITSAQELFEFMRERVSYYSGQKRLPVFTSIEAALRRQKPRSISINSNIVPVVSMIACKPERVKVGLNETRLTGCTWDNQRSCHYKSKSLEIGHSQMLRGMPLASIIQPSPSSFISNITTNWQPVSTFSNIMKGSQTITYSKNVKLSRLFESKNIENSSVKQSIVIPNGSRVVKLSESLEKTEKPKSIIKLSDSDVGMSKCVAIQLQTSLQSSKKGATPTDSLKISLDYDPLISQNVLTQEDVNLQLIDQKQFKNEYRNSKFNRNSKCNKKPIERRISILQFDEEVEKNESKPIHPHTYHQVNSNNLLEAEVERMPWRTNKTITRLINDDTDSLVHSIGSSSQENINGSLYSGVLTHMGRDITRKDIAISVSNKSHSSKIS